MKKLTLLFSVCVSFCSAQNSGTLDCIVWGNPFSPVNHTNDVGYSICGSIQDYAGCGLQSAMMIAVIDSFNLKPWTTCGRDFGQANPFQLTSGNCDSPSVIGVTFCNSRNRPEHYFIFRFNDTVQVDSLIHMLNAVPNGDFILAYTWLTYAYSAMPSYSVFKNSFINLGASSIATILDSVPYIFFCKKGSPATASEAMGAHPDDSISLSVPFLCNTSSVNELVISQAPVFSLVGSNGIYHISYAGDYGSLSSILIIDAEGRLIASRNKDIPEIDLSSGSAGIYFYETLTSSGHIFKGKISKLY